MKNRFMSIRSFKDLIVYQNTYKAMLLVMKELLPLLPESEKYDLKSTAFNIFKSNSTIDR